MIADPDMEVAVYPSREYAETLTYQDSFGCQSIILESGKIDELLESDNDQAISEFRENIDDVVLVKAAVLF